ncbi:MAG: rRNA maturation RNase YbeY [Ghiorsea sp.]
MINMIDILVDDDVVCVVDEDLIVEAVSQTCLLAENIENVSLCIRFSGNDVVQSLNAKWREKDKVTDVLSFPMQEEDLDVEESLGDIILAAPFVKQEAERLELTEQNHIVHLIVHGTLHLLGYDHIKDEEAEVMQKLENNMMKSLGLHQPYPEFLDEVRS